ncbi:MAG: FAD-binding oxidoreductase [Bdellovibrionota bacterium]
MAPRSATSHRMLFTGARFSAAVARWIHCLGADSVIVSTERCADFVQGCEPKHAVPPALLRPVSVHQLRELVQIAAEFSIPIHPVSRGKNWGYGSASASQEGCVVVDLGALNRVLEVNADLAYAVIEPGVTQEQLYRYLEEQNIPLMVDVTGAPPSASIVGNTIERGYGYTPYSDHFAHTACFEVLLSDGTLFETGFGRFANARAKYLHKTGIGPSLDGLFTQSNFGIVTKMAVWLMPKPDRCAAYVVQAQNDAELARMLVALRDLKLRGLVEGSPHVVNDLRSLSLLAQFPFDSSSPDTFGENELSILRKRWGVAPWTCIGGLWGTEGQVAESARAIAERMKSAGLTEPQILSALEVSGDQHDCTLPKTEEELTRYRAELMSALVSGIPTMRAIPGMYWRKRQPANRSSLDPIRDKCGLLWCSPVIPLTEADSNLLMSIIRGTCRERRLEVNVALALVNDRTATATVGLFFDPAEPEQRAAVEEAYSTLLRRFAESGYFPYRGADTLSELCGAPNQSEIAFQQVCYRIKSALDPQHIVSPNRYGII